MRTGAGGSGGHFCRRSDRSGRDRAVFSGAAALRSGSFYSLQRPDYPPFPVNPFPELPVYRIGDCDFVVDDRSVDYSREQSGAVLPSVLEQESGGALSYGPGDFWLEITEASESIVSLILHGTVLDAPYEVFSTTDLGTPRWKPKAIVIGQADQTAVNLAGTGEPVRFFRALTGETTVSISAVADATEPGPNGDPPGDLGQFIVYRTGSTTEPLDVEYSIGGTAINGVDYTELSGTVTIPAEEESASIWVQALYDQLAEFDETVALTLELTGEYLIHPDFYEDTVTILSPAFVRAAVLDGPVSIDYHEPLDSLIVSYNAATSGAPWNFARIDSNGQVTPWPSVSGLVEEVKIATAKQTASGWQQGQLYFGLGIAAGVEGRIGRVSVDGTGVTLNWANLPPPTGELFRGGLAFDEAGIFGGDLIGVTGAHYEQGGARQVWRVNSAGAPTLIASIGTSHLEGVAVLPDDPAWGGWAGKILTGNERNGVIYAVDTNGTATPYSLGIHPEDFDLIPPAQDLYCTAYDAFGGAILKIPSAYFADYVGQLLITQAGEHSQPAALYIERPWVALRASHVYPGQSATSSLATYEACTFATAGALAFRLRSREPRRVCLRSTILDYRLAGGVRRRVLAWNPAWPRSVFHAISVSRRVHPAEGRRHLSRERHWCDHASRPALGLDHRADSGHQSAGAVRHSCMSSGRQD